ncbi:hypothetical protein FQZ97_907930 [compost metagenome]
MRRTGEIHAAQHGIPLGVVIARVKEYLLQHRDKRLRHARELVAQRVERPASGQIELLIQPSDLPGFQPLHQRPHLLTALRNNIDCWLSPPPLSRNRKGEPQRLGTAFAGQVLAIVREAGKLINLGHQHVDRKLDAQFLAQFGQARPNPGRFDHPLLFGVPKQVLHADRHQRAVDRGAGAIFSQQAEESLPFCRVDRRTRFLRRIAACRVDQNRLIGEPPICLLGAIVREPPHSSDPR